VLNGILRIRIEILLRLINLKVVIFNGSGVLSTRQTGDWRNIMILMAYVDGFKLKNINIENYHAWAVSFERSINADISDIRIYNPGEINVNGEQIIT
jgi:hypothetical protein